MAEKLTEISGQAKEKAKSDIHICNLKKEEASTSDAVLPF